MKVFIGYDIIGRSNTDETNFKISPLKSQVIDHDVIREVEITLVEWLEAGFDPMIGSHNFTSVDRNFVKLQADEAIEEVFVARIAGVQAELTRALAEVASLNKQNENLCNLLSSSNKSIETLRENTRNLRRQIREEKSGKRFAGFQDIAGRVWKPTDQKNCYSFDGFVKPAHVLKNAFYKALPYYEEI